VPLKIASLHRGFAEHDAFRCGSRTPGQIMSAITLVEEVNAHGKDVSKWVNPLRTLAR
jgi:aerobic-type carbon monoxide dehydrogenase small subunit (CoxS/CutS family)